GARGGGLAGLGAVGQGGYPPAKGEALRRHGQAVYLMREPRYLLERIAGDPGRPQLSSEAAPLEIMARRDPWFRKAAHHVVDCGDRSKRELTDEVLDWFADQTGGLRRR